MQKTWKDRLGEYSSMATVLVCAFSMFMWLHGEFKEIHCEFADIRAEISKDRIDNAKALAEIKQDIAIIKTVLIMHHMLPNEMAQGE